MRILAAMMVFFLGFSKSFLLFADPYRACGNSLLGMHKAEENALLRALEARGRDGRDVEHSYKTKITYSVRDLNIDDHLPGTYSFEWRACVEVSDIPEHTDISNKPCSPSPESIPYGQIVPVVTTVYLTPQTFEGSKTLYWYKCTEIQNYDLDVEKKSICGESFNRPYEAFEKMHKEFSRWYVGKDHFLIGQEKPVNMHYSVVRSGFHPKYLDWQVCIIPPDLK